MKRSKPPSAQHAPGPHLLGLGLDHADGHKRITRSERFSIVGGSEETHGRMTETVVKTFETLDRKGKSLEDVNREELSDIIEASRPD
ncbi:MAG: hypothetical protein ACLFU4_08755 [Opitutales bacterium]